MDKLERRNLPHTLLFPKFPAETPFPSINRAEGGVVQSILIRSLSLSEYVWVYVWPKSVLFSLFSSHGLGLGRVVSGLPLVHGVGGE